MPSSLTRHVFRRILANQPILHRECLLLPRRQRRQFHFNNFNVFAARKKRETHEADMDPGIEEMMNLAKLERMRARLPPSEDVVRAVKRLLTQKRKKGAVLEDTQAQLVVQSLRHCGASLDRDTLHTAVVVLARPVQTDVAAHPALAKAIYDEILARERETPGGDLRTAAVEMYVRNLACSGRANEARDILVAFESESQYCNGEMEMERDPSSSDAAPSFLRSAWADVLHGVARRDDEADVLATLDMLRSRNLHEMKRVKQIMLHFRLRGNDTAAVREAWSHLRRSFPQPIPPKAARELGEQLRNVLQWCREHEEWESGHQIVRDAMENDNPPKPVWDAIFVWAAGTGKGADEIDRMLTVMESSNKSMPEAKAEGEGEGEGERPRIPDITTINLLVEFAISKSDPYLAERFISIGKARHIDPDASTYILQMQYRLKVADLDGALTAYTNLQSMDLSSNEDVPTINALIVALCASSRHDFDTIMNIAADLSDRHARFEAPTVSALTLLHLGRDEIHDVIDLLNTHAFHFSSSERQSIISAILTFALDPETPTPRAWDAYTILRQTFDEIPRDPRTRLMNSFFSHHHQRPDLAVHVFNHMRHHSRHDTLPTTETYIQAFAGSARAKDLESLEVIHNQLKLDVNINPTTRLYNSLIESYVQCDRPLRALRFWDAIASSREGPDWNSLHLTFRACEMAPLGDLRARELWSLLQRKGVDVKGDQGLWKSYVGALVGNNNGGGDLGYVFGVVEEAEREGKVVVDEGILGRIFNAVPTKASQREVEEWGKERWGSVWERLEKGGLRDGGRGDGGRIFLLGE